MLGSTDRHMHWSLLDLAEDLHMNCTGSSDTLGPKEAKETADFIQYRLDTWQKSAPLSAHYDNCVKALLSAVLVEYADLVRRFGQG
jgi:hypothetical protein